MDTSRWSGISRGEIARKSSAPRWLHRKLGSRRVQVDNCLRRRKDLAVAPDCVGPAPPTVDDVGMFADALGLDDLLYIEGFGDAATLRPTGIRNAARDRNTTRESGLPGPVSTGNDVSSDSETASSWHLGAPGTCRRLLLADTEGTESTTPSVQRIFST